MSDHADGIERGVLGPDSSFVEGVAEFDGVFASRFAIEDNDVAANAGRIDLEAWDLRDPFGEMLGVCVIFVEARRSFFYRDKARRSEHTNLAHASPEHFSEYAGAFDEFA